MNKKALKTLEFGKIKNYLEEMADSAIAKEKARRAMPETDLDLVKSLQAETTAALSRLYRHGAPSFSTLTDVKGALVLLDKGGALGTRDLLNISAILGIAKSMKDHDEKCETEDVLSGRYRSLVLNEDLRREINRVIIAVDEISDDASAELSNIRRKMKNLDDKIHSTLSKLLVSSANMLQDSIVTMRQGRYCFPVKSEFKSSFQGLIHDQSSSGSTFFMEPLSVVKLNNDLAELGSSEKEEINKILAGLSALCAPFATDIERNLAILADMDYIYARAKLSKKMRGSEPVYIHNCINIKKGRHPLIAEDKVVPIDVSLGKDYKMLIVTGPNTGGKTVSLKTVGLFCLMGQTGLHIPAGEGSDLRFFKDVYADIGDEQSIEQSLSTFSSHMTNTINILKRANKHTLVLFDELGAGTDPVEGAALAISILDYLREKRAVVMATTHYSELKVYALGTEMVENASLEFDMEKLMPTYRLIIGVPGKSNAFAISKRLGLSDEIISHAKTLVDQDQKNFEDVISSLDKTRNEIEAEKEKLVNLREQVERQKKNLDNKNERIDKSRDKILKRANDEAAKILQDAKDLADESIKRYNKLSIGGQNIKEMEKDRERLRGALRENADKDEKFGKNSKSKSKSPTAKAPQDLEVGDKVLIHSMGMEGEIATKPDSKGKCFVNAGIMRIEVKVNDLEYLQKTKQSPEPKQKYRGTSEMKMQKSANTSSQINLIGLTADEAIYKLDKYLDDAYLAGLNQVTVIHGVGSGVLKKAVREHLKKLKYVSSYREGEHGEGGYGVTVVQL